MSWNKEKESPGPAQEQVFFEVEQSGIITGFPYTETLFSRKTAFQQIDCLKTTAFGRALFLDGILNSTEYDEFIYHEGIVHPALMRTPQRQNILIIGGAEGGTLREVLKYPDVKRVVMVDIDGELVELCRAYLADIYGDPFSDPRVELLHQDGRTYVENCMQNGQKFDAIIIDINDAMEDSPAQLLFTREFYSIVQSCLQERGIVSIQAEWIHMQFHQDLLATVQSVFGGVKQIEINIPSFMMPTAFLLASPYAAFYEMSPAEIQDQMDRIQLQCRYYSPAMDQKIGILPPYLLARKSQHIFSDKDLPGYL